MPTEKEILDELKSAVIEGDSDRAKKISIESLALKMDPMLAISDGLMKGIGVVAERFANYGMFVTEVMLSADAMKAAMDVLRPSITGKRLSDLMAGKVVIGTVRGDIHDIGKNIVSTLLEASGFEMHDLGIDIPTMKFIEKAQEVHAQIIAASALLSTTAPYQAEIVKALDEMRLRDKHKVMIGGCVTTRKWADEIGADGYGEDAIEAVKVARTLVGSHK